MSTGSLQRTPSFCGVHEIKRRRVEPTAEAKLAKAEQRIGDLEREVRQLRKQIKQQDSSRSLDQKDGVSSEAAKSNAIGKAMVLNLKGMQPEDQARLLRAQHREDQAKIRKLATELLYERGKNANQEPHGIFDPV